MNVIENNFVSKDMSVRICFGNFDLFQRLKFVYYLLTGGTVRISGTCIQGFSAKDIKKVES